MIRVTLTPQQQAQLTQLLRQSPAHRVRQRYQALLWSQQEKKRPQIAQLHQLKADTVTAWFRRWQTQPTTDKLADAPRRGRPPKVEEAKKNDDLTNRPDPGQSQAMAGCSVQPAQDQSLDPQTHPAASRFSLETGS